MYVRSAQESNKSITAMKCKLSAGCFPGQTVLIRNSHILSNDIKQATQFGIYKHVPSSI